MTLEHDNGLSVLNLPEEQNGAIVLGSNINALGVIRSVGRLGINCAAVVPYENGDHCYHSKYLKTTYRIPKEAGDDEIRAALDLVSKSLPATHPLLIPTSDRFSHYICQNQDELARSYTLNCPDFELCDTFLDKWKTAEICKNNDVTIPMTYCPKSTQELSAMLEEVRFPLIVKPRYTFEGNFPGKNATFDEPDTLWRFFAENDVFADAVVQEIIPSGDGDIFVISSYSGADGRVAAMYSGRKIRQYLPDYGATCFGVSEKQPALERETLRFLDNIRYRGWAMVEFAQSRLDGQCYFLELNTRTSWTNQLYADTGVDLTQIGCVEMVGRDFRSVLGQAEQEEGIYWLDFRRDFASIRLKRRQGKITLPAWLRSIVRARSFAQWSWDDPRPFVVACLWRVGDLIQKLLLPRRFRNAEYK